MAHALRYTKHVFCLEGEMSPDLRDKSSVHAALIFLQQNFGIRFIFKTVGSKENLRNYINQWGKKKYAHYSICYLSFHGEKGCIELGDKFVYLDELARMLKGKCRNKIIHFGSCSTLKIDKKELEDFLKTTGALAVCGFKSEVSFIESSVFDLLLIDLFQKYLDISKLKKRLLLDYGPLVKKLDFQLIHRSRG